MAVGFFTQGIEFTLPHPPVPQRTILLLCEVIRKAWQLLAASPPPGFILQEATEDDITLELVDIIENRLRLTGEVDGFDHVRFGKVEREPKISNFNKEHPDKMPDIYFDLRREEYSILSNQDGLFVECKPIDSKPNHSLLTCYCRKGLIRFVNGDYAWAMQDALMVGYVSGDYSFTRLAFLLDEEAMNTFLKINTHSTVNKYEIYRSSHERGFDWPQNRGHACGISVTHLWLSL